MVLVRHDGTVLAYTLEKKKKKKKNLLFDNGINQIIIKQVKLHSVVCYFIMTCILSLNFKVALIFLLIVF